VIAHPFFDLGFKLICIHHHKLTIAIDPISVLSYKTLGKNNLVWKIIMIERYIEFDFTLLKEVFGTSPKIEDLVGPGLRVKILDYLLSLGVSDQPIIKGEVSPQAILNGPIYIAEGAKVEPFAMIEGPCYVGLRSEVRHGAYIRGDVFVANDCVVGHTTEVKASIFCPEAKAGHFAYIGNSVLGHRVNLGAGTKLANLRFDHQSIALRYPDTKIMTSLKKLGAVMGDDSQTGCNSVLSPGRVLSKGQSIAPCRFF
jgi:UDP-N-acetylglucosamine diphosphorylase / glucose-1-phosphate thymidylyltransferase / UDP-N-acetylgalactosamine diphosphorylase / glucosamine-1-phosphate N-acetyltransferase / galactosamine-1-phosphate N-acetyltransferase